MYDDEDLDQHLPNRYVCHLIEYTFGCLWLFLVLRMDERGILCLKVMIGTRIEKNNIVLFLKNKKLLKTDFKKKIHVMYEKY